jgi:hypothetical protein
MTRSAEHNHPDSTGSPVISTPQGSSQPNSFGLLLIRLWEAKSIPIPASVKNSNTLAAYCVLEYDKNESQVDAKSATKESINGVEYLNAVWQSRVHLYYLSVRSRYLITL